MSKKLDKNTFLQKLALTWTVNVLANHRFELTGNGCTGKLIVDFQMKAVVYAGQSSTQEEIETRLSDWSTTPESFNVRRLQSAEQCAISDIVRPWYMFTDPFKLFEWMDRRADEGGGTFSVWQADSWHHTGKNMTKWFIFDDPDKASRFEQAVSDWNASTSHEDKGRLNNLIFYFTHESMGERWWKVGELADGHGFVWLEALLNPQFVPDDMENFLNYDHIWCDGGCEFEANLQWEINNLGDHLHELRRVFDRHKQQHKNCLGSLH